MNSIPYLPPIPEKGEARVMWFASLWHAIATDTAHLRANNADIDAYIEWLCDGCLIATFTSDR